MSDNRIVLNGMEEFKRALRNLPQHLAEEAGSIVARHAEAAASNVVNEYHRHDKTGNLSSHVKVDRAETSGAGARARVRSTARHAFMFENGTQIRHTGSGANRGAMPPFHVFVPIAVRERRAMVNDLIGLVEREGFKVTGRG